MPGSSTVLYPADAKIDLKYYVEKHFALVEKHWRAFGVQSWKVVQLEAGPDGSKPYSVAAIIEWDNLDNLPKALQSPGGQEILGDVSNFSDKTPIFLAGNIIGSG